MAYGQTTSTLTTSLGAYYDKMFLTMETQLLRMVQFAQRRPLPSNQGKTAYFTGYRPLAKVTSALTEQTNPTTPKSFESRQISATVAEWGDTVQMGKLLELTKIDPGIERQVEIVADQAARSIDYQVMREVCYNGIWGISAANVTTDNFTATVVSSASNSTVTFCLLHVTSDAFAGSVVTVLADNSTASREDNVTLYGYAGRVKTYTSGTTNDVWVLASDGAPGLAAPGTFGSGVQVHIATQNNIDTSSILTTALVGRAQAQLIQNRAPMFSDGYYNAVWSPLTSRDFKTDTTWVNAASYSAINELYKGEVGRWFGFRVVETTNPYRESVAGVEADGSGAVYHNLFLGREAYGHTELAGKNQRLIYVNQGPDKTDPLDLYSLFGWKQVLANKALNANWAVSVMTGAAA